MPWDLIGIGSASALLMLWFGAVYFLGRNRFSPTSHEHVTTPITVDRLSKRYRIGARQQRQDTLGGRSSIWPAGR